MSAKLGAAGAGKFSPLEVGWLNAYWPGGPAFKAQGYSDGQVMNAGEPIPDEAGSYDMTAVAYDTETTLTYVESSNVNSQPAIRATDRTGAHARYSTGSFATPIGDDGGGLADATGWSLAVIWNQGAQSLSTIGTVAKDVDGLAFLSLFAINDGTLDVEIRSTDIYPAIGWSAGDTIAVLIKGTSNLKYLDVDGTNYLNATGAAAYSLRGIDMFSGGTGLSLNGDVAFLGLYDGDCTGDPAWSDFETWVTNKLGATI